MFEKDLNQSSATLIIYKKVASNLCPLLSPELLVSSSVIRIICILISKHLIHIGILVSICEKQLKWHIEKHTCRIHFIRDIITFVVAIYSLYSFYPTAVVFLTIMVIVCHCKRYSILFWWAATFITRWIITVWRRTISVLYVFPIIAHLFLWILNDCVLSFQWVTP